MSVGQKSENDENFEVVSKEEIAETNKEVEQSSGEDGDNASKVAAKESRELNEVIDKLKHSSITDKDKAIIRLVELKSEFIHWTDVRRETIFRLREIADYIDKVTTRSGVTKAIGSGSGIVAGGLTVVGGALTIFTAGAAAVPILLAGTSLGLAAGITGGSASVIEKIIKSRQLKTAEEAIAKDLEVTEHLEESLTTLSKNSYMSEIKKDLLVSGGGASASSLSLANLLTNSGGSAGFAKIGGEAVTKIFGEDIGKEVSKIILTTSGKVLSGAFTVVLGGVTMAYDTYRLHKEINEIVSKGSEGANDLRSIAHSMEKSLLEFDKEVVEENQDNKVFTVDKPLKGVEAEKKDLAEKVEKEISAESRAIKKLEKNITEMEAEEKSEEKLLDIEVNAAVELAKTAIESS